MVIITNDWVFSLAQQWAQNDGWLSLRRQLDLPQELKRPVPLELALVVEEGRARVKDALPDSGVAYPLAAEFAAREADTPK